MSIRPNVDIRRANALFSAFETACEKAPDGVFEMCKELRDTVLGYPADEFLRKAQIASLNVCNGDGIREIEALMFDMLRRENPGGEIDRAIQFGELLEEFPEAEDRLIEAIGADYELFWSDLRVRFMAITGGEPSEKAEAVMEGLKR